MPTSRRFPLPSTDPLTAAPRLPFTARERRLIARLRTPLAVQRWLNDLPYNDEAGGETLRSFRGVVRTGAVHCLEAALSAATILEQHGCAPLVMSLESIDLLDHVIFVYRTPTGWGSVARSRDPGLHGRKPLFATPRALALSYVEGYVDDTGRIKGYGVADLRVLDPYDWRLSDRNVWKVERLLIDWPHRSIRSSDVRIDRLRRRYRAFREAHGVKPWRYYQGRDRWTPLPRKYREDGVSRGRSRGSAS
ncbi:MAG: hypothetical protein FJW23_07775 [Acidimicrobiia bacterium]|nr:hypothetical protein [Acidimicrobiia bacterium]